MFENKKIAYIKMSNSDSSDQKTVFHFLNELRPKKGGSISEWCLYTVSSLGGGVSTYILKHFELQPFVWKVLYKWIKFEVLFTSWREHIECQN